LKLLQINTVVNAGSTGRIAENIGIALLAAGHKSYIAAGHTNQSSKSEVISIGNKLDRTFHGAKSFLLDRHGFGSACSTKTLINKIRKINPDIIHLHNIHGYYLHIGILFDYLKLAKKPIVWTLHDCWSFTGHCSHFENVGCIKWKTQCNHCPKIKAYPASLGIDNSEKNFLEKKKLFSELENLNVVAPSLWLANLVAYSFLKNYPVHVINNGIDTSVFKNGNSESIRNRTGLQDQQIVLGVANVWQSSKGLDDIVMLSKVLGENVTIVLVGLTDEQIKTLPGNIIGIPKTKNQQELVELYTMAAVFINPTYSDNFPTTNLEALACGTPVITYNTGGSPEAIDAQTGFVVNKGDIKMLSEKVQYIISMGKSFYSEACRKRAIHYFNKDDRYADYLDLYQRLLSNNINEGNSGNQQSLQNLPAD